MSTATSGRAREYKVRDWMIANGWVFIMRAAGSKGAADLLMAHDEYGAALVQVGTGNKTLGPAGRARLVDAANVCGALPLLVTVTRGKFQAWAVTMDTPANWPPWIVDTLSPIG